MVIGYKILASIVFLGLARKEEKGTMRDIYMIAFGANLYSLTSSVILSVMWL